MQVDYIALGRLVALIQQAKQDTSKFRLKPKALTWVFFALEIASLICQGAGACLLHALTHSLQAHSGPGSESRLKISRHVRARSSPRTRHPTSKQRLE